MSDFSIFLLGKPSIVELGAGGIFPEKGYQLLAIVALSQTGRMARGTAASILWDRQETSVARSNLRQLLLRMRSSLPNLNNYLVIDIHDICMGPDRREIDAYCLLNGDFNPQLHPYRGQLLDESNEMSESFLDWVQIERTRLRNQYLALTTEALMMITRQGRCKKAIIDHLADQMLEIELEREQTYSTLIEAYGRAGYVEEAAYLSQKLRNMLQTEHGTRPLPESDIIVRRVLARHHISQRPAEVQNTLQKPLPPRVAFLAPKWMALDETSQNLFQALIEDVVNELARFRTFTMLAPHSSFQLKSDSGIPHDNSILRADYTISGFVTPKATLSIRMVRCAGQEIVWTGSFPIQPEHILTCFGQLTRRIAGSLAEGLERHLAEEGKTTGNQSAYVHYLRGQSTMANCDLANLRRSRKLFRESGEADPSFAPAPARVAQTLYQEWLMTGGDDPQILAEARSNSDLAISIDVNNGIAQWMSGVISLYQRDFDVCEEHFETAEVLAPNAPDLLVQYGDALSHLGYSQRGMEKFNIALDLNPMPPEHYWWVGASIAFNQKDYQGAINFCHKIRNEESVLRILASAHGMSGNRELAREYGHRLREQYPNTSAADMVKLAPDRSDENKKLFVEGLQRAGVK
jgi:pentatricopeptide repeat protein